MFVKTTTISTLESCGAIAPRRRGGSEAPYKVMALFGKAFLKEDEERRRKALGSAEEPSLVPPSIHPFVWGFVTLFRQ